MTTGPDGLLLNALRQANLKRLPEFKNRKGEPAHSKKDGSDWKLSAWMNAVSGEAGEMAEALLIFKAIGKAADIIKKVERGDFSLDEARHALGEEFADVLTYPDRKRHHRIHCNPRRDMR